jgi:hypothetical protein
MPGLRNEIDSVIHHENIAPPHRGSCDSLPLGMRLDRIQNQAQQHGAGRRGGTGLGVGPPPGEFTHGEGAQGT